MSKNQTFILKTFLHFCSVYLAHVQIIFYRFLKFLMQQLQTKEDDLVNRLSPNLFGLENKMIDKYIHQEEETYLSLQQIIDSSEEEMLVYSLFSSIWNSQRGNLISSIMLNGDINQYLRVDFICSSALIELASHTEIMNNLGKACQFLCYRNRKIVHDFWKYLIDTLEWNNILPVLHADAVMLEIEESEDPEWILLFSQVCIFHADQIHNRIIDEDEVRINPAVYALVRLLKSEFFD